MLICSNPHIEHSFAPAHIFIHYGWPSTAIVASIFARPLGLRFAHVIAAPRIADLAANTDATAQKFGEALGTKRFQLGQLRVDRGAASSWRARTRGFKTSQCWLEVFNRIRGHDRARIRDAISVELDSGRTIIIFDPAKYNRLDWGRASTTFKAQGADDPTVFASIAPPKRRDLRTLR
jgi:hypothetical protein